MIQPMRFSGRREATRAPTAEKAVDRSTGKITGAISWVGTSADQPKNMIAKAAAAMSMESTQEKTASRPAVRLLILPILRSGSVFRLSAVGAICLFPRPILHDKDLQALRTIATEKKYSSHRHETRCARSSQRPCLSADSRLTPRTAISGEMTTAADTIPALTGSNVLGERTL